MLGLANRMSLSLGSSIAGAAILAETRNFTTFVSAGSKQVTFATKSFSGDFNVNIDISCATSTAFQALVSGGASAGQMEVFLNNTGVVFFFIAGTTLITGTISVDDSKLNNIRVARVGTTITLFINGVADGTTSNSDTLSLDTIGARSGGSFFSDCIIANVDLNGERIYKLDETWAGPSTVAVDTGSDGSNGTAVNITTADSENFTFDGSVSPNTWTNDAKTIVIEIAGT